MIYIFWKYRKYSEYFIGKYNQKMYPTTTQAGCQGGEVIDHFWHCADLVLVLVLVLALLLLVVVIFYW
jgi:hypothetical protein